MDLFEILELKPNASEIEIKKAYHRLAKKYHPDKCSFADATDKFQKIQSAYEILNNDETRKEYQKMTFDDKINFANILEKAINNNLNFDQLKNYGINFKKSDLDYLQNNFINFFKSINVGELLRFFKKGVVPQKDFHNQLDCSESEYDTFNEDYADYFYDLPISIQKINKLDIRLDLGINLGDIINNNKKKIKLKRNINGENVITNFIFNLSLPYVVFNGAGDCNDTTFGNLIIKLNLPNNLCWRENIIIIEQHMSLYEMIYGLDIILNLGEDKKINIQNWVPSRDGFIIDINSLENSKIEINIKSNKYNLVLKLFLNYEHTDDKEGILKQLFS